ncbi:MAG: DEAD/DEAH box helicase, partial [Actinomycetota bacterium]|nr:DEAD/DEAH box helicase [Actinomycetota bacterium]
MTSLRLRPWQRAAFDQFTGSNSPDFLAVATPGAGKTTFALTCALAHLASSPGRLVVVAPTSHLKTQWARAAHRLGLALDIDWAPGQGLARDVHGLVTTYQQVANGSAAERLQGIARDGLVVLDEIHHAGDERAWGSSVLSAFSTASRRLALSGTPFRSDDTPIPFITYETTAEGDLARADVTYGYDDALRDGGVVRPVYFPRFDGQMEWSTPTGDVVRANFADELNRDQVSARLRTALSLDGDWLPQVLTQADQRLRAIRSTDPDAGGLVIATDVDHAHGVARLLRNRLGVHADVVVSDDPSASAKIAAFANDDRPWLISVRMVSEGVDIPRLRVGVYATTVATELFFRQAVGRFVRWQTGRGTQRAYVFIPDDPRLRTHAFRIAESRRHALRPPGRDDDEESFQRGPTEANAVDERPEQLSLFSVVSSTATGMQVHAITEHGLQEFDDDELVPEPAQ